MAKNNIKISFDLIAAIVPFSKLVETSPRKNFRNLKSFRTILASIKKVGLLEPLVICRSKIPNKYKLINGHLRMYALKELGFSECNCIFGKDEERYTFETQVNYINPLQRSKMIRKAIKGGLTAAEIAETFGIDEKRINREASISAEIDPAAIEILKSRKVCEKTLKYIARVKPYRQMKMARIMCDANNFSSSFAKALFLSSSESEMKVPSKNKSTNRASLEKLNEELEATNEQLRNVEERYEINVHTLVTTIGFIKKILDNPNIDDYVSRHFGNTYPTLKNIIKSETLL